MVKRSCCIAFVLSATVAFGVACAPPPQPPPPTAGTCLDGSAAVADLRYDGPIDVVDNATLHDSTDGTCSDVDPDAVTVVRVTSGGSAAASARCETRETGFGPAVKLRSNGYSSAPSNLYLCEGSVSSQPTGEIEPGTCFDGTSDPTQDMRYDGPDDGVDNASFLTSTDGSCAGSVALFATVLFAEDQAAASDLCEERGTGFGPASAPPPGLYSPELPSRAWLCVGSIHPPLGDPPTPGTCYDGTSSDLSYEGGIEDLGNLLFYGSNDGSCTEPPFAAYTGVWAGSQAAANALCVDRQAEAGAPAEPVWTAFPVALSFPTAPGGLWMCTGSSQPPPPPPVSDCFASDGTSSDLGLTGPLDTLANASAFPDESGCLIGPAFVGGTVVQAADAPAALVICQGLGAWHTSAIALTAFGFSGAPADLFLCNPFTEP